MSRNISEAIKKRVAGEQYYKCANMPSNDPNLNMRYLENYRCPLWCNPGIYQGSFDESGYEIDHILEFSLGGSNDMKNLQALCKNCHSVKTKRFNYDRCQQTTNNEISPNENKISKNKPEENKPKENKPMKNKPKENKPRELINIPNQNILLNNRTGCSTKYNINTASKKDLIKINGISGETANKIIANRPYKSLNEVYKLKGIGPVKCEIIKENMYI